MPYYDFRCNVCGDTLPIFRKIESRDFPEYHCAQAMNRLVTASQLVLPDLTPYVSPVSGKWINSRRQRNEELAREGCFILEPGVKRDIARNAQAKKEKNLQRMDATIDQTVSALHAAGQI